MSKLVTARELKAGDVVISDGEKLTVAEADYANRMGQNPVMMGGWEGSKFAIRVKFVDDPTEHHMYPSQLVRLYQAP